MRYFLDYTNVRWWTNMSNKKLENEQVKNWLIFIKTRKDRNYTLQQVAYKTGLSHTYISQLERGLRATPVPEDLRKIAKGFRVDYNFWCL